MKAKLMSRVRKAKYRVLYGYWWVAALVAKCIEITTLTDITDEEWTYVDPRTATLYCHGVLSTRQVASIVRTQRAERLATK